jgi:DNA polymerase-3 subunit epsilon
MSEAGLDYSYFRWGGQMGRYVAIDFETANESRDSACEVSLVRFLGGQPKEKLTSLIYQERFSPFNISIHGIQARDVANAPKFHEIWPEISDFIGRDPLVAHNAGFDMSVLVRSLGERQIETSISYFCTMVLGRRFLPIAYFSLGNVAAHLGINHLGNHRAEDDAMTAGLVAAAYLENQNVSDLDELATKLNVQKGTLDQRGAASSFYRGRTASLSASERAEILKSIDPSELYEDPDFVGRKVVFTGELDSMTRREAQTAVMRAGGLIINSVSSKTNLVVTGYQDPRQLKPGEVMSSKLRKATDLRSQGHEIEIVDEVMFRQMLEFPEGLSN